MDIVLLLPCCPLQTRSCGSLKYVKLVCFFSQISDRPLFQKKPPRPFLSCIFIYAWCRHLHLKFKRVCTCKVGTYKSRPTSSLLWKTCLAVFLSVVNIVK